jgi:hypothetical protein
MHDLTDVSNEDIQERIDVLVATSCTPLRDDIECHCGDEFDENTRVDFCVWDDEYALTDLLEFRRMR